MWKAPSSSLFWKILYTQNRCFLFSFLPRCLLRFRTVNTPEEHVFDLRLPSFKCLRQIRAWFFIGPIPTLLFLAIATIIWKPSSFNDGNDRSQRSYGNQALPDHFQTALPMLPPDWAEKSFVLFCPIGEQQLLRYCGVFLHDYFRIAILAWFVHS